MLQAMAAGVVAGGLALSPLHLQAQLSGPHQVHGHAEYAYETGHPREVDIELHHVTPGERMKVYLHGVLIGELLVDRRGEADREIHTSTSCRAGQQVRIWHNQVLVASGSFRTAHDD